MLRSLAGRLGIMPVVPVITVTGTNGKGTTVALLEQLLLRQGYRVGVNTSPHILHYNERIRINGEVVGDDRLCSAFSVIDQMAGDNNPLTFSHYALMAALWMFRHTPLDLVILEIGVGGRLDPANAVDADVAVITNIALDHMHMLGPTRARIGCEKAAIGRCGKPMVITDTDLPGEVEAYCQRYQFDYRLINRDFSYAYEQGIMTYRSNNVSWQFPVPPHIHPLNVVTALAVLDVLQQRFPVQAEVMASIAAGFVMPGRIQVLATVPALVVIDVAHNVAAVEYLFATLKAGFAPPRRVHVLYTAIAHKDVSGIVELVSPLVDVWHVVSLRDMDQRASSLEQLTADICNYEDHKPVFAYHSVSQAWQGANRSLAPGDWLISFGSFLLVAEVLRLSGEKVQPHALA